MPCYAMHGVMISTAAAYLCLILANLVDRHLVPLLHTLTTRLKLTDVSNLLPTNQKQHSLVFQ
jgi:hypothetical protein